MIGHSTIIVSRNNFRNAEIQEYSISSANNNNTDPAALEAKLIIQLKPKCRLKDIALIDHLRSAASMRITTVSTIGLTSAALVFVKNWVIGATASANTAVR